MENIKTYKGRDISCRAKTAIKRIMHYTMLALLGLILFRIARTKEGRKEAGANERSGLIQCWLHPLHSSPSFFRVLTSTLSSKYPRGIAFCWRRRRGEKRKLYYTYPWSFSLNPLSSCNDERIKGAQPLWTLADTLIHIRYTGKGKVQIKKTLSLSLSGYCRG